MSSVSVVIPCYRYGHFLEAAVHSVLNNQSGVDVRVLIIDDASPDDSAEVAERIAASTPHVDVIVHPTNKGNIATYNEGLLEWADGDYCLLMSADDRATPGALRRAGDLLDAHPEVGFAYGRSLWVADGAPLPSTRTTVRGWSVWSGQWWLERRFRQAENPITSPEIVVRTSLQKRVGGYDPHVPYAADMEMYMRLAAYADVGFLRGVDQAYYRVHGENMSKAVSALGFAPSGGPSSRWCWTATARGWSTRCVCPTLCTASLAERRSGLPEGSTTAGGCGRPHSADASWGRERTRRKLMWKSSWPSQWTAGPKRNGRACSARWGS